MGLFGNLFKKETNETSPVSSQDRSIPPQKPFTGLNLEKGGILDLTKQAPGLEHARVAAGWDMARHGADYDLDLCAFLLDKNGRCVKSCKSCVYFADRKSRGIYLDKDNRTGAGDGDDENIFVTMSELSPEVERIVFAVVIFNPGLSQSFKGVKNAYVRLVNSDNNDEEICHFNLTESGKDNTAVIFAELYKESGSWNFKAVGELCRASIRELRSRYS